MKKCELKIADILDLSLNKQMFGWQKVEEKYIIWKHAVKWRKYAEINSRDESLLFEGFNKKKKRRRIEVLFNCMQKFNLIRNMKENKIYNIFTRNNLEFIVRKAVRKKNSSWMYSEYEEEANSGNLIDNWKIKIKKPPDKIVNLELLICLKNYEKKIKKMFKGREGGRNNPSEVGSQKNS
jgi:hypothetical protein